MLSKAMIQKAGNAAKCAVEKVLAGKVSPPQSKRKSRSPKKTGRSAYEEASEMGPFKGDTLDDLVRVARKTKALPQETIERYEATANSANDKVRDRAIRGFRSELQMYGVRFK